MKKMKKVNLLAIMALMFIVVATSCSSDDGDRPTIEFLQPISHPVYQPGDTIHLHAILRDNVGLSQYKIDIHYAGDGHTHGVVPLSNSVEWIYLHEGTITGTVHTLQAEIEIPTSIDGSQIKAGEYHVGVFVINSSGSDNKAFVDIDIE
jgi:hypothetical protein